MTDHNAFAEATETIQDYFDGLYHADTKRLAKVFHPDARYTQIVVGDSSSGAFTQSRDLLPGGLRWTVSDFAAKKEILLAKLGWGGIPTHMIKDELDHGNLIPLNIEGYPPRQSQLFQIRKRDKDVGVVAQSIWERLMSVSLGGECK